MGEITRTAGEQAGIDWIKVNYEEFRSKAVKRAVGITIAGTIVNVLLAASGFSLGPVSIIVAIGYFVAETAIVNKKRKELIEECGVEPATMQNTLELFARTVLKAGIRANIFDESIEQQAIRVHVRSDNCYRIVLETESSEVSKLFSGAVWELLGPVQNHRYLIERRKYTIPLEQLSGYQISNSENIPTEIEAWHPVPSLFGKKKSVAQIFEKVWNEEIGLGKICYTRSEEGRELLTSTFRKRPVELLRERKTIWE